VRTSPRALVAAVALAAALVPGALAAGPPPSIATVDMAGYPTVRATVVTPRPTVKPPRLRENGKPVIGFEATNLGAEKSIVLIVDRSQSMQGKAIRDASAAAREFVAAKGRTDRIAVVAVGKRPLQLTQFATAGADAVEALRTLQVDPVRGTALYDSIVLSAEALAGDRSGGRVIVLLTDGQEVSSDASLAAAIEAAREARVTVYPIGIESPSFRPAPLERLARETGGRYQGAAGTEALRAIYVSLAQELERTWHVSYVTAARPGDRIALSSGPARAEARAPGRAAAAAGSNIPEPVFKAGPVFLATFVGLCVLLGVVVLIRGPMGSQLRRRIDPHLDTGDGARARGPAQERFATASTVLRVTESLFGELKVWHRLHRLLERADLPLRTVELVYISLGTGAVVGLLALLFAGGMPALLLGFAGGASLPILFVVYKARKRLTLLEDQLPDLLITLAASLKAGHSFRQGIQAVVDEGQPPASTEFKRVLTETRLGRPMDAALQDMGERIGSKNLTFVITAVTIQRQVGGSLAGIFDMVAEAVRNRQQFARKIRSLTAMGRASAYVLVGIPFFMLGILTLVNRDYMEPLYHTSTGHKLMLIGVVMMAIGSMMIRRIVSFRG
jgi:tight adherence protein B